MHILISPNAFKNSLSAHDAAVAIRKGFSQSRLNFTSTLFPIADGGDGTAALITNLCRGNFSEHVANDPFGKKIKATIGFIHDGKTAVIDLATASGLGLIKSEERNPLQASTYGTGQLILFALEQKVKQIIIGVGGSATVDGGCGIAEALGVRFLNRAGNTIKPIPENLLDLYDVDISQMDKRIFDCECHILCDVHNRLLGDEGAAAVFGPQKGASPEDVNQLEKVLSHLNAVVLKKTGIDMSIIPHGGAAGGAAAGLTAFCHAKPVTGIDYFLAVTGFNDALSSADLLVTGEGSIDEQTLSGKGPYGVALRAKDKNIPVIAFAGNVPLQNNPKLREYFDVLLAIGNAPQSIASALPQTTDNLVRTAMQAGELIHFAGMALDPNDRR